MRITRMDSTETYQLQGDKFGVDGDKSSRLRYFIGP